MPSRCVYPSEPAPAARYLPESVCCLRENIRDRVILTIPPPISGTDTERLITGSNGYAPVCVVVYALSKQARPTALSQTWWRLHGLRLACPH